MLSRALSLATAMLLIGFAAPSFLIAPASAQNLEAGKSPAQLFSANCTVCHKSARGLLKSVPPGDLPGFLRQHYTTSADMAKSISAYLVANGASAGGGRKPADDGLTRRGRELTREQQPAPADAGRQRPPAVERQQAQPGAEVAAPTEQAPRRGRTRRQQLPAETAPAAEGQPAAAEAERPANQKQKINKKNRRQKEEPKPDTAKDEPRHDGKPDTDKAEPAKPEPAKSEPAKSEPAKSEPPKEAAPPKSVEQPKPAEAVKPEPKAETPATRSDPVPAVTPAPKEPEPSAPASPPPAAAPSPEPAKPSTE